ncbi:MAG: membrane-associated phospholipid phosphatase [Flavobacteriaceae bacterium]
MKTLFKLISTYLVLSILAIIAGGVILGLTTKIGGHLAVNATHTPFQDIAFLWITHIGDGIFVIVGTVVLTLLYWKRYGISILLLSLINLAIVGGLVAFFKHLVFADAFRPIKFIGRENLYIVPDAPINLANSFPSGHTTAAFAFFALVAFLFPTNRIAQALCVVIAVLVGYSRIYLSQHFLEDVVAGAVLGIICFILSYFIVRALPLKNNLTR